MRNSSGFTLLEVVVAFIILTLTLGAALQIFGRGLENTAVSEDYMMAVNLAKSRLALVGQEEALAAGESSGEFTGGFRWRALIIPVPTDTFISDSSDDPNAAGGSPAVEFQPSGTMRRSNEGRQSSAPSAQPSPDAEQESGLLVAYEVRVTVSWGTGDGTRDVTLVTLRAAPVEEER